MSGNTALDDEVEALTSIYDTDVISLTATTDNGTPATLSLPTTAYAFTLTFPPTYPDTPPLITGTHHVAAHARGAGEHATGILRDVLSRTFAPGQVALFDLIEEATPLLQDAPDTSTDRSVETGAPASEPALTEEIGPAPGWWISEPLVVNKSTFVARCVGVKSLEEARGSISHLLGTNKRVAGATHNITAWRMKQMSSGGTEVVVQDSDDDGETAAGGRLLHLMQLMDVWDVVVVVTRWYGGVKLGPDRFRCINAVARDVLSKAGFVKDEKEKGGGKKGKK